MLLLSVLMATASAFAPPAARTLPARSAPITAVASADVPDMGKRVLMNWILVGSAATTIAGLGVPYVYFFYPRVAGGGGGVLAADANGDAVLVSKWLETHKDRTPELVQGLKGDA